MRERKGEDKGERQLLAGCGILLLAFIICVGVTIHIKKKKEDVAQYQDKPKTVTAIVNGHERVLDTSQSLTVYLPKRGSFVAQGNQWIINEYEALTNELSDEEMERLDRTVDVPQRVYKQLQPATSGRMIHPCNSSALYFASPGDIIVYYKQHVSRISQGMHLWFEPIEAWMVIDEKTAVEVVFGETAFDSAEYHVVEDGKVLKLSGPPSVR